MAPNGCSSSGAAAAGAAAAPAVGEAAPGAAAEDKAADGSAVAHISEADKTEALIKRLQGCVTGLLAKLTGLVSPVTNLITKMLSLPWTSITLLVSSNLSHVLVMMAWLALTSNPLAYGLPVLSLGLPMLLSRLGDKIPASRQDSVSSSCDLGLPDLLSEKEHTLQNAFILKDFLSFDFAQANMFLF